MDALSISQLKKYDGSDKIDKKKKIYDIGTLPHGNFFYKYMDLESALISLEQNNEKNPNLRFVEPTNWDDEYEGRFYNADYRKVDSTGQQSPFLYACCMTAKSENEAAWLVYNHGRKGLASHCVEFKINRKKLREEIMKNLNDEEVYIGNVTYCGKQTIDHLHEPKIGKNKKDNAGYHVYFDEFNKVNYLNLLLLKRLAYKHEEEIRIFIIPNEKKVKYQGKKLDKKNEAQSLFVDIDWIYILDGINIDKECSNYEKELLQNLVNKLLEKKKNDLGILYEDKYKKLRVQFINVYEDNRSNRIVIDKL